MLSTCAWIMLCLSSRPARWLHDLPLWWMCISPSLSNTGAQRGPAEQQSGNSASQEKRLRVPCVRLLGQAQRSELRWFEAHITLQPTIQEVGEWPILDVDGLCRVLNALLPVVAS
jgi:hypothetical protein